MMRVSICQNADIYHLSGPWPWLKFQYMALSGVFAKDDEDP